ncbi:VOC family protein [Muricoccus aerilatus]|uniref:VOC family protein n=1 Tax=Muricoccus aerilatus TaxID=452982 RepID=UPI000694ADDE|nr:VOC family protein [Roseomonas aerilata]
MIQPISHLRSLSLDVTEVDASVRYYVDAYGLAEAQAAEDSVMLVTRRDARPVLHLRRAAAACFRGLSLALRSEAAVHMAARDLAAAGVPVLRLPGASGQASVLIAGPDGQEIELIHDEDLPSSEGNDGYPLFVSHVVLNSTEPARLVSFFTDTLGFTVADRYERDLLTFLRCDQPQHHCIGVSPGVASGLNHFSMDCGSVDGVMRGVGRMAKMGHSPIWGPGRHGPGGNVFCYFEDPAGFVIEFTSDVLQIDDPTSWIAKEWPREPDTANVWGTGGPSARAIALMSGER